MTPDTNNAPRMLSLVLLGSLGFWTALALWVLA